MRITIDVVEHLVNVGILRANMRSGSCDFDFNLQVFRTEYRYRIEYV